METSEDKIDDNEKEEQKAKTSDQKEETSPKKSSLAATEQPDWANLLDEKQTNKLLYSLQIVEALGQPSKKRRSKSEVRS